MGQLLEYLKTPHPIDAEPLDAKPFGLIPYRLPAILLKAPEPGSEPLPIGAQPVSAYASAQAPKNLSVEASGEGPKNTGTFSQRWPEQQLAPAAAWFLALLAPSKKTEPAPSEVPDDSPERLSFAPEPSGLPDWAKWMKVN